MKKFATAGAIITCILFSASHASDEEPLKSPKASLLSAPVKPLTYSQDILDTPADSLRGWLVFYEFFRSFRTKEGN
jgi:hypothetical protein